VSLLWPDANQHPAPILANNDHPRAGPFMWLTLVVTERRCAMRSVGVRGFRDRATSMMATGETLVIERRGEPIGFFVPITATDRRGGRDALGRLGEIVDDVMARTGLDEDQLVGEVASRRPSR
jgi:hypothetical protein